MSDQQIPASHPVVDRGELAALRREMLLEVRQISSLITEWRTAHESVHLAQQRALDSMANALAAEKADTRRRFELVEAKVNEMRLTLGREARSEGKPGRDLMVERAAIITIITIITTVIGSLFFILNFFLK